MIHLLILDLRWLYQDVIKVSTINDSKKESPAEGLKDLKINMDEGTVYYKNSPVNLTALEYGVISLFIKNPNRIFTREHLLQIFWEDNEQFVNDNTLTTTIKRIRDKTSKDLITTIRGIGYRME